MCCRSWGDCWMSKLLDIFDDVTRLGTKIPTSEYQKYGEYPIFDQGQEYISGYTCEKEGIYENVPAIIFGDHTRVLKYVDMPCFLGADGVKLLKAKRNDVNTKYLFYRLCAADIPNTGYNRHFKWLKEVEFMLPSFEEQKEISSNLDKVTQTIDLCNTILEKLDLLVKSQFVEMFGDPVDNSKGWEKKCLQDIVTNDCTISYGIVQTGDEQEDGIPVFRPIDIVNHIPMINELKKTTEEISNKFRKTILKGRELLITVRANIADTYIIGEEFKGCNVGRGIVPIRTKEEIIILEFLKYLLDNKHLNDYIKSKAKGITLIQLNLEDLREIELIIPPIEQQKQFADFVKTIDKSKLAVKKTLEKAETLKKALMQEYFG